MYCSVAIRYRCDFGAPLDRCLRVGGCARPETPGFVVAVLQRRRCDAQTTANEDLLVGGMSLALVGPPAVCSSRCLCFSSVLQHASLSKLQCCSVFTAV